MTKKKYTKRDLKKFDRLTLLMSSSSQMERINGRLEWRKFAERFDKETLDAMFEEVKKADSKT